jgi:hypothetical protein
MRATTMPVQLRLSPGLCLAAAGRGGQGSASIVFAKDEPAPVAGSSKALGQVVPEKQASPVVGRELALSPICSWRMR